MHPHATYLPIIQFHANFIANYNADQVPTNLPMPTELLWTAVITDYAMPTYFCNLCLFCFLFILHCFCSLLVVSLCCCHLANAFRVTMDCRLCDDQFEKYECVLLRNRLRCSGPRAPCVPGYPSYACLRRLAR
jgi:hypothetical protein